MTGASLGTDGFGLSDTRSALRRHFHVDAASITLAVLTQLAKRGEVKQETLKDAIARYHLKNGVTEIGDTAETNDTETMGVLILEFSKAPRPRGRGPFRLYRGGGAPQAGEQG